MGCLTFFMIAFNVIFWLIGAVMLALGIWMAVYPGAFDALGIANTAGMNDALWAAAVYMIIGIGAFVFLIGFLGCVGARKEECGFALHLYIVLVGIVVVAEIIIVILVAVYWSSINDSIAKSMQYDVNHYYVNETDTGGISSSWNKMQTSWKCCGSYNYTDFVNSLYTNTSGKSVPYTCCTKTDVNNQDAVNRECRMDAYREKDYSGYLFTKGCFQGLTEFLDKNAPIIIGIACGFAVLEIFGLICACSLMKSNKRNKDKAYA